jgi:hypothetical protein
MLRFAADENFNHRVLVGLLHRLPTLDIIRVQEAGLTGADDPTVLAWTAAEARVLLTHDVTTMTAYAYERLARGEAMPGVFVVPNQLPIGQAIEDLVLLAEGSEEEEWDGQVRYLPL